jgi:transcription elongation GreA/GreB family factor
MRYARGVTLPDKRKVLDVLLARLAEVVEHMTAIAESTRKGATHAEAKPENDKDTRALEQSYLARGQAMRVEELLEQLQVLRFLPLRVYGEDDPIAAGALIRLESEHGDRCLFLVPHGGGIELTVDGCEIQVITPQSALGALVLGRALGDEVELRVRGGAREYAIAAVR